MVCYLVRHGKDDETVRGGWSDSSLSEDGIEQVKQLAKCLFENPNFFIGHIFSSDLLRTQQTTEILNAVFHLPVEFIPEFREVNNGLLTGMKNELAIVQFPGLYWSTLDWEEQYPDGESPREFFERVSHAWYEFKNRISDFPYDVMLVTHGGVMNVIQCLEHEIEYSNKRNPFPVGYAEMIAIEI